MDGFAPLFHDPEAEPVAGSFALSLRADIELVSPTVAEEEGCGMERPNGRVASWAVRKAVDPPRNKMADRKSRTGVCRWERSGIRFPVKILRATLGMG